MNDEIFWIGLLVIPIRYVVHMLIEATPGHTKTLQTLKLDDKTCLCSLPDPLCGQSVLVLRGPLLKQDSCTAWESPLEDSAYEPFLNPKP